MLILSWSVWYSLQNFKILLRNHLNLDNMAQISICPKDLVFFLKCWPDFWKKIKIFELFQKTWPDHNNNKTYMNQVDIMLRNCRNFDHFDCVIRICLMTILITSILVWVFRNFWWFLKKVFQKDLIRSW